VRSGLLQLEVNGNAPFPMMRTLLLLRDGLNNYADLTKGNAMRSTILALVSGFGLVAASAALADQTAAPMAQPVSTVQDSDNPVICHTLMHEGELIRSRVCKTKHQWDAIRYHDQQAIRDFQNASLTKTH
jgi:hypothetical protein